MTGMELSHGRAWAGDWLRVSRISKRFFQLSSKIRVSAQADENSEWNGAGTCIWANGKCLSFIAWDAESASISWILHIECELPKVLIKVLFCALFWGKELFWILFWVLLIVPELFWALSKALYFALLWNTFLGNFLKHYFENFFGGKVLFWAPFLVLFKVLELFCALF